MKRAALPLYLMPLAALLAGAANVFSFAPFHLSWLQVLTLGWLFSTFNRHTSTWRHALHGWLFSLGAIAASTHWLFYSMHDFGNLPAWMAAMAVVLLAACLGLYAGILLGAASWLRNRYILPAPALFLLVLPAMWTLSEWLRGWILTGFPWASSGYAHTSGALSGYAPMVGVYGLALLTSILAGTLVVLMRRQVSVRIASALILTILLGGIVLQQVRWTTPSGEPVQVRLLQGNVPQEMKFNPETTLASLRMYDQMIRQMPADLVALPETAIPVLPRQLPDNYLGGLRQFAKDTGTHIALGIPLSNTRLDYANSMVGIAPEQDQFYRYDKHHLVPFGEFVPDGFRWFVRMMQIPLGDMTRGSLEQSPFAVRDQWVMPNICYEDLFGEEIAQQISNNAAQGVEPTMLLNMSNIAWFSDSIAIPQHLQISQMRALETGRPMLRSTNTGATAIIDAHGKVQAVLPAYTQDVLSGSVQGYSGLTPYIRFGNLPAILLALAMIACARVFRHKLPQRAA